jgi:Putative prokaryotic signal transducing protein
MQRQSFILITADLFGPRSDQLIDWQRIEFSCLPYAIRRVLSMKTIKTYPTNVEADLARIALDAAGIPAVVVGVGFGMEGGGAGVQLLVPDDRVEAALTVLGDS